MTQENEVKDDLFNNYEINVIKAERKLSRSKDKPSKLTRVITDSSNHVTAAV